MRATINRQSKYGQSKLSKPYRDFNDQTYSKNSYVNSIYHFKAQQSATNLDNDNNNNNNNRNDFDFTNTSLIKNKTKYIDHYKLDLNKGNCGIDVGITQADNPMSQ